MTVNRLDGPVAGEHEIANGQEDAKVDEAIGDAPASPVTASDTPAVSSDFSEPNSPERRREALEVPEGSPGLETKSNASHGAVRSTSSKFASLRATFEQSGSSDDTASTIRRRQPSSDKTQEVTSAQRESYENEISRLKTEVEKEKELRITFEEKVTSLEEEIESLHEQLGRRDEQWRDEFEKRSAELMEAAEVRLDMMASEARSHEDEALNLQRQLADLKQGIATSTRTGLQISDTTFKQEFDTLQYEVQNWVVNHFRRIKVEVSAEQMCERLEKVAEARHLKHLKPLYEKYDSGAKIPILQATVATYMLEIFDEPYLYGLQGQAEFGKRAKQAADSLSSVLDQESYHRWRATTFDAIRNLESIKGPIDSAATGLAEIICIALKAITDADDAENRQPTLKPIILRAISVSHLIRVQQATYEFRLPYADNVFDPDSMDSIVEDPDESDQRTIRCSTFPAVIKTSAVERDAPNPSGVVVKAKVLCHDDAATAS